MIQVIIFAVIFLATVVSLIISLVLGTIWIIKKRKKVSLNKTLLRLKRSTVIFGCSLVLTIAFTAYSQIAADTPAILNSEGNVTKGSIAELRKVDLNGRKEWISIRGQSTKKPILLFLAGGPGGTQMAAVRHNLGELEKYFLVVNWDQAGSGKSYYSADTTDITVDTYIQDGYALTKYLCKTFGQQKIYLVGESWGSALGIFLASKYPESYHAFIGTGQMVDFVQTEILDYKKAIEIAKAKNDTKKISKLEKNGLPPYYGSDVTWKSAEYLNYLSSYMARNSEIKNPGFNTLEDMFSSEYGILDKINFFRGVINTFNHVYPQLYKTDLRKDYKKIDVPVYFFIGRHDINAPVSLVDEYYNILQAPDKEFVWFEHSGHSPWINESDKFVQELRRVFRQ